MKLDLEREHSYLIVYYRLAATPLGALEDGGESTLYLSYLHIKERPKDNHPVAFI